MTGHIRRRPESEVEPGFKRSSWAGFFSASVGPAGMLGMVKRAMSGEGASPLEPAAAHARSQPCPLADVKKHLAILLNDCPDNSARMRIENRISAAASVAELWLLRCDIYQLVAQERGQGEASRRINSLLPVFEGSIPAKQLGRI